MNIFYLHQDPIVAPQYLYNKHCVKMILETAQMLCTAHHHWNEQGGIPTDYIPYRKAYFNHPSTKWARESKANYIWLWEYFMSINVEYFKRYDKVHLCWTTCKDVLKDAPIGITDKPFTQPPQCMPDEFKAESSIDAYWNYYIKAKGHIAYDWEGKWVYRPREIEQLKEYNNWKYKN